ncbi:DUF2505 family protein [Gordonia sp. JH63]|uniref:DUF2505 domain-containing protein n=1 Tax=Gordonia hongkongensis TaxID=1701090 RepID=A0AAX3T8P9_9ACTN|nr:MULTISPECIES: DUF2505 domain-containing protein [Gordonia]MCZ4534034.1 DUF2505 domain-containing protein [Gordonia terrae]OCW87341.1 hypothetical protein A8M60_17310 [Nocardia farcinica]KSU58839.1 hypothetical protein AS181_09100 [Gordonia sp. SGD-V-85]MBN0972456.1 DUF2505 domain-containing protein [Gordonia sp. BP-119]MBN0982562.1 DUF2505 domain-containing protein [Gordonia sp. BP-94]
MARRLSYSARYTQSAEKLYQAQSIKQYWDDMMAGFQMISPHCEVDSFVSDETGIRVVLKQTIGRDQLPALAQTVMKKDMVITREETLGPFDPDNTKGTYNASIPAGPGSLNGWQELFPTENGGCTIRRTSEAKVFVPFVNGKLEQMILINLVDLFRAEAEYAKDWVDKNL